MEFDYDLNCWEGRFRWLISYVKDGFLEWEVPLRGVSKGLHDEAGGFLLPCYHHPERWRLIDHPEVRPRMRVPLMHRLAQFNPTNPNPNHTERIRELLNIKSYREGALMLAEGRTHDDSYKTYWSQKVYIQIIFNHFIFFFFFNLN